MGASRSPKQSRGLSRLGEASAKKRRGSSVLVPAKGLEKFVHDRVLHTDMHEHILADAARLSDEQLLSRLKDLACRERDATVEVVGHLAELDTRRSHLGEGPGSVSAYCRDVLGYSEDAAWNRAATANVVRRYPVVLGWLADGTLNVTTVRLLRPVLTDANHLALLTEARRRSKTEVELIVRRVDPRPDVLPTIRKVAAPAPPAEPSLLVSDDSVTPPPPSPPPPPPAPHRPVIAPLAPERYKVEFTISKETLDKLRRVQNLLCREIRNGNPAVIFDLGLDELLEKVEKAKLAATSKPRAPREATSGSRDVPAHVQRVVWKRDEGRCAFKGRIGRCTEKRFLEWHHVQPAGHQGPATVENISLRCRAHNVYESELVFGPFDASARRTTTVEMYRLSREYTPFRNGGGQCG